MKLNSIHCILWTKNPSSLSLGFLCLVSLALTSCNLGAGFTGVSGSIAESKERKVFICEYMTSPNPYIINDSLHIFVKSAWLEKRWKQTKNFGTYDIDGYQLIIKAHADDLKNYDRYWSIGTDQERYIRTAGGGYMISNFDSLPTTVKEVWKVQEGIAFHPSIEKKIIGEFAIYRITDIPKQLLLNGAVGEGKTKDTVRKEVKRKEERQYELRKRAD